MKYYVTKNGCGLIESIEERHSDNLIEISESLFNQLKNAESPAETESLLPAGCVFNAE